LAEVSNGRANLHLHTVFSDGELEPAEVVDAHAAAGFSAIALTDHDTLAGIDALGGLEGRSLRMIPGVELSIEDEPRRGLVDAHLLGYGFALADRRLRRRLHEASEAREAQKVETVRRLAAAGFDVTWGEVRARARGNVGKPHIVAAIEAAQPGVQREALFRHLKEFPRVATVSSKAAMLQSFRETSARNVLYFTTILTAFASVIAIGVVYNNARIALQERAWELASLRVLGFTRGEVSTFLLGELAFELAVAVPLGCLLGYLLSWAIVTMSHTDMISIPIVVAPRTYAFAALAIMLAGAASALIVRRRIDRLDLVGVLKTRE